MYVIQLRSKETSERQRLVRRRDPYDLVTDWNNFVLVGTEDYIRL